jgi:hypothetical protein
MSRLPPQPPSFTSEPVAEVALSDVLSRAAERNLAVAMSLRATAWQLTEAGLRTFRPELSEVEVQAEVRALFRRTSG